MTAKIKKHHIIIAIIVLIIAFVVGVLLSSSGTQAEKTIYLKGSGSSFDGSTWNNPYYVDVEPDGNKAYYSVWHLVYSNKNDIDKVVSMQISFTNGTKFNWDSSMGFSTNGGDNNKGWVIYAPYDYEININNNKSFLITTDTKNSQFNISGYSKGKAPQIVGSVKLTKVDSSDKNKLLSGAIFSLKDKDGNIVSKETVNGIATWSDLPLGDYTISETKAPAGYDLTTYKLYDDDNNLIANNKITISKYNQSIKCVATNQKVKTGSVTLTKVDSKDSKKLLSGAIFSLKDKDGNIVTAETINGIATWSDLPLGDYTITETKAPVGYDLSTYKLYDDNNNLITNNKITIKSDKQNFKCVAKNEKEKTGSVSLTKVDSKDSKKLLSGAIFSLKDKDGNITTKQAINGTVSWNDLPLGEYTITETKAASGYDLTTYKLFDDNNNLITNNKITISKDNLNLKCVAKNDKLLGSVSLTKVDFKDSKMLLSGAAFSLEDKDGNITTKQAINGTLKFSDLPLGEYTLVETKAASGYDITSYKLFDEDNNPISDNKITITEKNLDLKCIATNKELKGSISLTKVDAKDSEKLLSGAAFSLEDKDGNITTKQAINGTLKFSDLPLGEYTLVETKAASGYDITSYKLFDKDNNPITDNKVTITEENLDLKCIATNVELKGSISLTKVDAKDSEKFLSGAAFSLEDKNGNITTKTAIGGSLKFSDLPLGEYALVETKAASGYDITSYKLFDEDNNPITDNKITISEKNLDLKCIATNEELKGSISLTKVDAKDSEKLLSGAGFSLEDKDGNITTKEAINGTLKFSDLPLGEYTLTEIKAASGYDLTSYKLFDKDNNPITDNKITISEESLDLKCIATNAELVEVRENLGSISITKVDSKDADKLLSGAVFALEDTDGNIVTKEAIDGIASWGALLPGDYMISETKAASGYTKDSFKLYDEDNELITDNKVTIGNDTLNLKLKATNIKKEVQGETATPGAVAGETDTPSAVDNENPTFIQKILGEESTTSDIVNIAILIFIVLVALAVAGGIFAQRRINKRK